MASFVLLLGATINMDETAFYQGVATVFIAGTRPHRARLPDRHTGKGFHPRRLATRVAVSTGPE